jgi:hypothetical protein
MAIWTWKQAMASETGYGIRNGLWHRFFSEYESDMYADSGAEWLPSAEMGDGPTPRTAQVVQMLQTEAPRQVTHFYRKFIAGIEKIDFASDVIGEIAQSASTTVASLTGGTPKLFLLLPPGQNCGKNGTRMPTRRRMLILRGVQNM